MARRRRLDTFTGELPDEKRDRLAREAIERRKDAYAALLTPEGWDAFLRARLLHRYSWRNCALIAAQAPDALQVATYAQWKAAGAQVRENEHAGIRICRKTPKGFGTCSLFDITQTDAAQDIAEEDIYPPGFADALQALSEAAPRPRTLEDIAKAGSAIDAAHKAAERTEA
jgi:hypothetical protein